MIDGIVRPAIVWTRGHGQHAVGNGHARIGLNDVHVVRGDGRAVRGVDHGHRGMGLEEGRQLTVGMRIEVLDDDEGEVRARRQGANQVRQRTESTRGGTNADDRERILHSLAHSP
jgi:hypothetical protein